MMAFETQLNRHELMRVEVGARGGKQIVALSRWRMTPDGVKRTGQAFEFGSHRLAVVSGLLAQAQEVASEHS